MHLVFYAQQKNPFRDESYREDGKILFQREIFQNEDEGRKKKEKESKSRYLGFYAPRDVLMRCVTTHYHMRTRRSSFHKRRIKQRNKVITKLSAKRGFRRRKKKLRLSYSRRHHILAGSSKIFFLSYLRSTFLRARIQSSLLKLCVCTPPQVKLKSGININVGYKCLWCVPFSLSKVFFPKKPIFCESGRIITPFLY